MTEVIGIPHYYLSVIVMSCKLIGKPLEPIGDLGSLCIMYGMFKVKLISHVAILLFNLMVSFVHDFFHVSFGFILFGL